MNRQWCPGGRSLFVKGTGESTQQPQLLEHYAATARSILGVVSLPGQVGPDTPSSSLLDLDPGRGDQAEGGGVLLDLDQVMEMVLEEMASFITSAGRSRISRARRRPPF